MDAVLLWVRHDVRQRWLSLIALALVVAFVSGTVATALAGASRGASSLDRLLDESRGENALIPANPGIKYPWHEFDELPYVEARAGMAAIAGAQPVDLDLASDEWLTTPADDQWFSTIDLPIVAEGRPYDPDTPDELLVSPEFAEKNDVAVGDDLRVQLPTPQQARKAAQRMESIRDPRGPIVSWHVVGIATSAWLSPETSAPDGKAAVSPATLTAHAANLLGGMSLQEATIISIFRLQDESDLGALTKDARRLTGQTDVDTWDMEAKFFRPARDSLTFEARTLAAFGLAALLAGAFLLGGVLARISAAAVERLAPGPSVGMSPRQRVLAAALPVTGAGMVGALLGFAGAVVASGWFPVGTARGFEPHPGRDIDWLVLPVVLAATALFCGGVAIVAASRRASRAGRGAALRVSKVATWCAQASAPVPVVLGTRLALEPQRGRDAVPVRPAQVGAIAAAAGTIAALVFSHGIDDAIANPERFGQVQQADAFIGYGGQTFGDADALTEQVRSFDYVSGVVDARQGNATADDDRVAMIVYSGSTGPKAIDPVVAHGRSPETSDEIMLGTGTAESLDAEVGDTVTLSGSAGTRAFTVVGTGFLPQGAHNGYTDGAWVTDKAYPLLFDDFHFRGLLVRSDTLSPAALADRLTKDTGTSFAVSGSPDVVEQLRSVRRFPVALAGFLALLGIGVVGNALVLAVRRREGDLAVGRALGLTGRQAAATIGVQSLTLALVGLLYGAPLGLVIGRALWRTVAETLPLQYVAPASLSAVVWVVAVALGLTVLLALLPARRAARFPIAAVLRAE